MEVITISEVAATFGVSTRMLRYYEQIGLLTSTRVEGYAYRLYNHSAVQKVKQILVLRRLRIPLKDIKVMLTEPKAEQSIAILEKNIAELGEECKALDLIKTLLQKLLDKLRASDQWHLPDVILEDAELIASIERILCTSINFREDQAVKNVGKPEQTAGKIDDVRIVYLPPATVAAAQYVGEEPEAKVHAMIDRFVLTRGLHKTYPEMRHYGFNAPNPIDESGYHGYEVWVTIPEGMAVEPPLVKKHFAGGLYAAHVIAMGDFQEWEWLMAWLQKNETYEFAGDDDATHMYGLLEEHLNYMTHVTLQQTEPEGMQLDLLMPVKKKE